MTQIDFGRHSSDYVSFRPRYPSGFYDRLGRLLTLEGSGVLDLGCGPGTIALELARRGGHVTGIDISPELIEQAVGLADDGGLGDRTEFHVRRAESTGFDDGAFDMITAGQCWHWFDGEAVYAECNRLLTPGGHLVITYYSYLAAHSDLARESEALILDFNPEWTMAGSSGVFPELIDEVTWAGFEFVEAFCFDQNENYSHEAWRGRMRTSNGVGSGTLTAAGVAGFDRALESLLRQNYPDPIPVAHRMWCIVARKPG